MTRINFGSGEVFRDGPVLIAGRRPRHSTVPRRAPLTDWQQVNAGRKALGGSEKDSAIPIPMTGYPSANGGAIPTPQA